LDNTPRKSETLFDEFIADEAHEATSIKQDEPVMVVVGNPPYSGHSINNGKWISDLLKDYYQVDGQPLGERNPKYLQDDYVKFIRFSQWRIQKTGQGILAFITNHGYLDNPTFRGMRRSLDKTFDEMYVFDLHGNSKKKEVAPDGSKDENVFDIQQGVAIGLMVKLPTQE
jgi:predicted helicase